MAHANKPVPSVKEVRPDRPTELEQVVQRLMAKEPAQRFQTPVEVVAALQPFLAANLTAETVTLIRTSTERPLTVPLMSEQRALPPEGSTEVNVTTTPSHKQTMVMMGIVGGSILLLLALASVIWHSGITSEQQAMEQQVAYAAQLNLSVEFENNLGMRFRLIPPGEFDMGSPANEKDRDDEEHQHRVRLTKAFYMGVHEVTQEQYEKVMDTNPSRFKGANLPVENVSWEDAQEFIKKLNVMEKGTGRVYRLPTEAEWEYTCRSGSRDRFCFGNDEAQLWKYAWYDSNAVSKTHPVGQKKPNAWGLYDMHGNVREWCQDGYEAAFYKKENGTAIDPLNGQTNKSRVLRGGSWCHYAGVCRSANRNGNAPGDRDDDLGFRVVSAASRTP
jgi:formylglycine-generating enzyme required for sulfatase activity